MFPGLLGTVCCRYLLIVLNSGLGFSASSGLVRKYLLIGSVLIPDSEVIFHPDWSQLFFYLLLPNQVIKFVLTTVQKVPSRHYTRPRGPRAFCSSFRLPER